MSMQDSSGTPSYLNCTDGIATQWQDFLLLVSRVLMGWIFVASGWRKLMDIPGFVKTMPRRDLPDFLGYVAPPVEFVGGIFMIVGFATRYTSLVMLLFPQGLAVQGFESGEELAAAFDLLRHRGAASIRVATLLDKVPCRVIPVPVDWAGWRIGSEFVVGYGLDYAQKYRELPYVGVLQPE